jgi:hypothetical protein
LERKKRDEFGLQQASHEGFEPIRILIDDDCECKKQKALAG